MARNKSIQPKPKAGNLPDDKRVIDVLRATNGNISTAAKRLATKPHILYYWLKLDPTRKEALQQIRDDHDNGIMDLAITALEKNLKSNDGRIRNMAINVAFKYMGKKRGYVPATFVENENIGDITVKVIRE